MKRTVSLAFQVLVLILGTALVCVANRQYGITPSKVRGASMEPTLKPGQTYFVHAWDKTLSRGEIVVLNDGMEGEAVKRIVGLPGETIRIDGAVWINNRKFVETNLPTWMRTYCAHGKPCEEYHLKSDQYFVLGDNRVMSEDSRDYGPISSGQVRGKIHCTPN